MVRSITLGKDESHVVDLLHRKVFGWRHGDNHTPSGVQVRCGVRSGEESQLHAESDQDDSRNCDNGMGAHDGSPIFAARDIPANRSNETNWSLPPSLPALVGRYNDVIFAGGREKV
jgi:hypothetical protein